MNEASSFLLQFKKKNKTTYKMTNLYLTCSWCRANVTTLRISVCTCFWDTHRHISVHSSAAPDRNQDSNANFVCKRARFIRISPIYMCVLRGASALFKKNEKAINLVMSAPVETWNKTGCQAWPFQERATLGLVHSGTAEDIPEITGRAQQLQGATKREEGRRRGGQEGRRQEGRPAGPLLKSSAGRAVKQT